MIVFDLECRSGDHRFEGWFGSSDDFASQVARGLLVCPQCGSIDVIKAPMAPNLGRKGNQRVGAAPATTAAAAVQAQTAAVPAAAVGKGVIPPEAAEVLQQLARLQSEALKESRWVGSRFAEESRAIHYGERQGESIHGQATPEEARALVDEGIEIAPLPFPVTPPGKAN